MRQQRTCVVWHGVETPQNGDISRETFYYESEWIFAKGRLIMGVLSTKLQVQINKECLDTDREYYNKGHEFYKQKPETEIAINSSILSAASDPQGCCLQVGVYPFVVDKVKASFFWGWTHSGPR
jgi:hypothetical protein